MLLGKLNLDCYKDIFAAEQISGEVLVECDDEVLSNDLQITSKLHRMRILRIIQGRQSVLELLTSADGGSP